jgi:hypothetical protein
MPVSKANRIHRENMILIIAADAVRYAHRHPDWLPHLGRWRERLPRILDMLVALGNLKLVAGRYRSK